MEKYMMCAPGTVCEGRIYYDMERPTTTTCSITIRGNSSTELLGFWLAAEF